MAIPGHKAVTTIHRTALTALCIVLSLPSYAQFLPDLQAKTPEEYDAYLDVLDGPVLEKGIAFERTFPQSALLLPVSELMTRAARAQGDVNRAVEQAALGLAVAPDYVPLLVELADLLANSSNDLHRAESAANRALVLLRTAKAPRRIPPDEWTAAVATLRARAHGALGVIRFKQDNTAGARKEFEKALAVETQESPILHYRLGRLLAAAGQPAEARRHLTLAAARGEKLIRDLATAALAQLP